MTLTRFQQGELAAFKALEAGLLEAHEAGEQLEIEFVFETLRKSIAILEAFDKKSAESAKSS